MGAMRAGSIGRLGKNGRLVYVEKVTRYAAYLISLPDQPDDVDETDCRFLGPPRLITTSPYMEFYSSDVKELSEANLDFLLTITNLEDGKSAHDVVRGATIVEPVAPSSTTHDAPQELHLCVVRTEGLGKGNLRLTAEVARLGQPTMAQVSALAGSLGMTVAQCEFMVANLVKLGFLRWQ